jgi:hypothetical protein
MCLRLCVGQVFDNAVTAAGLLNNSRIMLPRLNLLLQRLMASGGKAASEPQPAPAEAAEAAKAE